MRRAGRSAAIPLLLAAALALAPFPERGATKKKEDLPHPKTVEELQKAMKDVLDKSTYPSRSGAGGERSASLVRRNRQGRYRHRPRNELRHGISRRLDQQNVCRAGASEIEEEGKINLYARLQGCRAGNPRE